MSRSSTAAGGLAPYAAVARSPFLLLPVTLVASGTGAAVHVGMADWWHAALALVGLLGAHVAVNALNEASDFKSGIDLRTRRTPFSGGSGTLPAGLLDYRAASRTGLAGGGVAIVIGLYFLIAVGWKLLPILVLGGLATFGYTGFLARAYVGELFAGLGLGALPVIGAALVQTGQYEPAAIAAGIPAFLMTFNLLLLNEFPDEEADREGGRRNLVILLERRDAALIFVMCSVLVPVWLVVAVALELLPRAALLATLPSLALVPALHWGLRTPDLPVPNAALGSNVIWNLSTNAVLAIALML